MGDRVSEPPHDPLRSQQRRAREQDGEFVAADPGDEVALPYSVLEYLADPHEGVVADRVAVSIVQRLEAVGVEDRHRERMAVVARKLGLEACEEAPPIRQAGEGIRRGRGLCRLM